MDKIKRIQQLVKELNIYRNEYYNQNNPEVNDKQYDDLFDELSNLESITGYIPSNSPSGNVCYPVPNDRDIVYLHNYKIYDYLINGNKNYEIVRMNNCAKIEFDKNQESVLYLYAKESYRYWFVNHNGKLLVSRSQKGEQGKKVEDFLLPDMSQFTEDNKFDAKKYFEEKSVD